MINNNYLVLVTRLLCYKLGKWLGNQLITYLIN